MQEVPREAAPHLDPARFDELIESIGPESLLALVERAMGPSARAICEPEDVWQETLAQAWRDRGQHAWTGTRGYRNWLLTIAKNRIKDMLRVAGAEKRGGGESAVTFGALRGDASAGLSSLLPAGSVTPSRVASHNERAKMVLAALASLPADVEPVVRLHLLEETPMPQVAAELGLGLAQAWRRFRRGAEVYRATLKALESTSGPRRPA
jgi:RNA polymerase sigma factor (sigma-70 family)